jgi:hypothetical protein
MPIKKPTKLEKLGNLTKATLSFIKSGLKKSSNEVYDSRVLTCLGCTEYDSKDDECNKCGCDITIKASWLSEECPLDKWTI